MCSAASAEKLTLERLFAAPDLSGASLRSPLISPDGRFVAYLRGKDSNKDRLDLWAYDITRREHKLLVDSATLVPQERALSQEEEDRRERQRTSSLSGIVDYEFSPDARYLLVPLGGDLYVYDLHAKPEKAVRRLTNTPSYETDAHFSPRGSYVSFIRDQNLVIYDLATSKERALTHDGGGLVSYGTAEFIAQEEMDRTTGYWWSPDEKRIAFARVDETPVAEVDRFEADSVKVIKQRYPAAGARNALVQLFVKRLNNADAGAGTGVGTGADTGMGTGATTGARVKRAPTVTPNADADDAPVQVDLGTNPDIYLARVDWLPNSAALAVQRQSRDQKTLTLLKADATTGAATELLSEHSDTWVDLHDEITFLRQSPRFIWASSRTGFKHLYCTTSTASCSIPLRVANGKSKAIAPRGRSAASTRSTARVLHVQRRDAARAPSLLRFIDDAQSTPHQITTQPVGTPPPCRKTLTSSSTRSRHPNGRPPSRCAPPTERHLPRSFRTK